VAQNVSKENIYIRLAKLNGQLLDRPYLFYDEIQKGGELIFEMNDGKKY
jgi:putative alpha-1,2-mannosidase